MRPTSVEPVKVSLRTAGFSQNSRPMSEERFEVMTLKRPCGDACAFGEDGHRERGQRRFGGGAGDEAAADGKRGGDLAGDHGVGEVPGRDRGGDADRLLDDHQAQVALVAGDGFAVDALGLFAEPFDEGRAVDHLALRLGQGLAHFGGQDRAEVIGIGDHQVGPFAQDRGAFLAGAGGPFVAGLVGGGDGAGGLGPAEIREGCR